MSKFIGLVLFIILLPLWFPLLLAIFGSLAVLLLIFVVCCIIVATFND